MTCANYRRNSVHDYVSDSLEIKVQYQSTHHMAVTVLDLII